MAFSLHFPFLPSPICLSFGADHLGLKGMRVLRSGTLHQSRVSSRSARASFRERAVKAPAWIALFFFSPSMFRVGPCARLSYLKPSSLPHLANACRWWWCVKSGAAELAVLEGLFQLSHCHSVAGQSWTWTHTPCSNALPTSLLHHFICETPRDCKTLSNPHSSDSPVPSISPIKPTEAPAPWILTLPSLLACQVLRPLPGELHAGQLHARGCICMCSWYMCICISAV